CGWPAPRPAPTRMTTTGSRRGRWRDYGLQSAARAAPRRASPPRRAAGLPLLRRAAGKPRRPRPRHGRAAALRPGRRGRPAGAGRALGRPSYGVPDPDVAFSFNELVLEAAARDDRLRVGLWVSPRPEDAERTAKALALAGEPGVRALKLSFLLGGRPTDASCRPRLDEIFRVAAARDLVVHVHTSPGAASDVDQVGALVDDYGEASAIHLVHFGGGV